MKLLNLRLELQCAVQCRAENDYSQDIAHMTNHEIARLLRDYRNTKNNTRELRLKMLRVAVEELGVKRKEAQQTNLEVFLDRYLVGQGMVQPWRKTGT